MNIRTAIAVLACLATVPWALLGIFYAGLQLDEGGDDGPLLALVAVAPTVALACFIAAVSRSRSGQTTHYVALLMAGALLVGAFFAVGEL
ncbi:MAG: hypothetical protein M3N47_00300 [Chloroflexota bacterium]|nr:hypothetical protein [Chloroflexota bacterium]